MLAGKRRHQTCSLNSWRRLHLPSGRARSAASRSRALVAAPYTSGHSRACHDPCDAHGGVVQKYSVIVFTMIAKSLAVVRQQNNQRLLCGRFLLHCVQHAPQLLIFKCDLGIVGILRILLAKLGRGLIREMRVVRNVPTENMACPIAAAASESRDRRSRWPHASIPGDPGFCAGQADHRRWQSLD